MSETVFLQAAQEMRPIFLSQTGLKQLTSFSDIFFTVKANAQQFETLSKNPFVRYGMQVEYLWPTDVNGAKFVENVANGVLERFGKEGLANVQVFSPVQGMKNNAQNLRGTLLQRLEKIFPKDFSKWRQAPEEAPSQSSQLHLFLYPKGILGGRVSPLSSRNFFAGGQRFVASKVSRAGAKFIEAESHLRLNQCDVRNLKHWLEFGAAPGGITALLLERGHAVDAVDRAALEKSLLTNPKLRFFQSDANSFEADKNYDALLCDMNGDSMTSAKIVSRQALALKNDAQVVFTLKLDNVQHWKEKLAEIESVFAKSGLKLWDCLHLFHNRDEVTLFLKKD